MDEVAGAPGADSNDTAPPRIATGLRRRRCSSRRAAGPSAQPPPAVVPKPAAEQGWLAFVPSPDGYTLVPHPGSLPVPGDVLELDGAAFRVLRYAPSPLPGDRRRCAVVAREEPPEPERTSDA